MVELVLLVDTELALPERGDTLASHGFEIVRCGSWAEARAVIAARSAAVLVTDAVERGAPAEARALADEYPGVEIVLAAPEGVAANMLPGLADGGTEFLARSDSLPTAVARLRRALRHRETRLEVERLRRDVERNRGFARILGTSAPMQALFALLDRAAQTRASVLIVGESGTGKELVARALHELGPRRAQPFVAINCSAVPEPLLESELFGHVRGAFTDAKEARTGLFVRAHGGTLFLDEIGDLPLALQPKLLRALQERTVRPVGGNEETAIDVRVIAATNQDLEDAVQRGAFREDLYYRLNVICLEMPPLRERASDIVLLAERFAEASARDLGKPPVGLSRAAARRLLSYGWPGNVRELQNCMERAVALTRDDEIQVADLPDRVRNTAPPATSVAQPDELVPLDEIERRYIAHVMTALHGNKKAAARVLGLDRKTLYRKLERYGLVVGRDDDGE